MEVELDKERECEGERESTFVSELGSDSGSITFCVALGNAIYPLCILIPHLLKLKL